MSLKGVKIIDVGQRRVGSQSFGRWKHAAGGEEAAQPWEGSQCPWTGHEDD